MSEPVFFDTQGLTRLVERCFDLSMSGAVPPETRVEFLAQGKRLRELLVRALGARFDAGSADFQQARVALQDVNTSLEGAANDLARVVQLVGRLGELAGHLDKALGLAARLVV